MRTCADCIPCLLRQAHEAIRMTQLPPAAHEALCRDVLWFIAGCD